MKDSYTKNYILIYFWQILSVFLGLVSLFIVIPLLSADESLFGIYSICISLTAFYSYADIGFITAGQKYASEYFAKGNLKDEIKVIAFTSFVFFLFVSLIGFVILVFGFFPQIVISGLKLDQEYTVARKLLIILAFSSPIIVAQRTIQSIFTIRVTDYIYQKFTVIGNVLKILSVFYFFRPGTYNIVNYFLFTQIINICIVLVAIFYVKKKVNYSILLFFQSFRFNSLVFNSVKSLAFSSLIVTVSWIIFYELDIFVIGKVMGIKSASMFAISLSVMSLFRSFFGIFYSPFTARFNHFIGNKDLEGLKYFFIHIVKILLPIIVISVLVVSILMKSFILSWVGSSYYDAIEVTALIILSNIFAFISYPVGALIVSLEKIRLMYINSIIIPVVYWLGITLTYSYFGIKSFAIFKIIAFTITASVYLRFALVFTGYSLIQFFKSILIPYILPVFSTVLIAIYIRNILPSDNSKISLLLNIISILIIIIIGLGLSIITSKYFRNYVFNFVNSLSIKI